MEHATDTEREPGRGHAAGPAPAASWSELALDLLHVGVGLVDHDLVVRYVNPALAAMNGIAVEDHLGRPLLEAVPGLAAEAHTAIRTVRDTGEPVGPLSIVRHDDAGGVARSFDVGYAPVDLGGPGPGVVLLVAETTEEQRRRLLEHRLGVLREADVVGVVTGAGDEIVDANRFVLRLLGVDDRPLAGLRWSQLVAPGSTAVDGAMAAAMAASGASPAYEVDLVGAGGRHVPVLVSGVAFGREPLRWLRLVVDLTAQRRAELAGALDAMLDMVAIQAPVRDEHGRVVDFRIEYANAAMCDAYGRSAAELVGERMLALYPELAGSALFDAYRHVAETGEQHVDPELVFEPADPSLPARIYEISVSPFGDAVLTSTRDVTERTEARRALDRSRAQLEAAERLADVGSWEWNLDTNERHWSKGLYRLFDIDPETPTAVRDRLAVQRIHPDDREIWRGVLDDARRRGGPVRYEQRLLLPTGERVTVVHGELRTTAEGTLFVGTVHDVTDLRRAETQSEHGRLALESMQRACLPDQLPEIAGMGVAAVYRPAIGADRLGGDWYDAFELPEGRVGLVVGDVTGHGLGAAVVMSQLRNALRAFAMDGRRPDDVLWSLGRFLRRAGTGGFATCLYAIVHPVDRTLVWARAGHPPFLVVDGDGWTAPEDGVGPPLGVSTTGYELREATLPPGALLALYTDGLVETRERSIDDGIGRLAASLVAGARSDVGELVVDAVDGQLGQRSNVDDVCLLLAKLSGG